MIRAFFLDVSDGKLQRLAYFGYTLLLDILGLIFMFGIVTMIAGAETAMSGDLQEAQAALRKAFSDPLIAALMIFLAAALFVSLNMGTKRMRDIGLPGWMAVAALAIITVGISMLISDEAAHGYSFLAWIGMLVTPSNLVGKS